MRRRPLRGGKLSKRHELVIPAGRDESRGREFARVIRWFEFVRAAAARNRHVFWGYTCKRINESQNQQSASLHSFPAGWKICKLAREIREAQGKRERERERERERDRGKETGEIGGSALDPNTRVPPHGPGEQLKEAHNRASPLSLSLSLSLFLSLWKILLPRPRVVCIQLSNNCFLN